VILVDTSAWVEFLRRTGSSVNLRVEALVADGARIAITDPVRMELLAGTRGRAEHERIRRLAGSCELQRVNTAIDFDSAAAVWRTCRSRGRPVRSLTDCLIAAVAIRADVPVLHADRDYSAIAASTSLALA
jgi:predicted nucleic acid-binding protein